MANLIKLSFSISMVAQPIFIEKVGLYLAIVCTVSITTLVLYCTWLLLQARNRFKKDRIINIGDLGAKLYGENFRYLFSGIHLVA